MIRMHDVSLAAGAKNAKCVLEHASCAIPQGGFRWLTGPSGAGKTTLLRTLGTARAPLRGTIEVLGVNPASANRTARARLRRRIGTIDQDYRLLTDISVFDNVALPLRLEAMAERAIRHEVGDVLDWLRIGALATRLPANLSGGEQQRVAIARALVKRPALLLADEPTNALDDAESTRLVHLFADLAGRGTTIVIATHNPALPQRFPAPALLLDGRGRLSQAAA